MRIIRVSLAAALLMMQAVLRPDISVGQGPPPPPATPAPEARPGPRPHPALATREEAIREIQRAYDHLNGVGDLAGPGKAGDSSFAQLLTGGKRAYEAALSRYQTGNYTSAREQAAAANDLAAAANGLLRRQAGAANAGKLGLKPPPATQPTGEETYRVKMDALRVSGDADRLASAVGNLPQSEPARQVVALAQTLASNARRAGEDGKVAEGRDMAGAAEAASRAAHHLYTDYYASRGGAPPMDIGPAAPPPDRPPPPPAR